MAKPLRIELAGGVYHVTSRGDRRENIYRSDEDRVEWLAVLGQLCARFNWRCHAWCQMSNHFHLVLETPDANLSQGMRQLNGVYTQRFNRHHGLAGHLFQGRFKAILVERETYLLELALEQRLGAWKPVDKLREVPRAQRRVLAKPLAEFAATYPAAPRGHGACFSDRSVFHAGDRRAFPSTLLDGQPGGKLARWGAEMLPSRVNGSC